MKKILIISRAFYPLNSPRSFRTTELAKELARQGHKVRVYIPKKLEVHANFEKEYGITIKDFGKIYVDKTDQREVQKTPSIFKRIINRILYQLFYYPGIQYLFLVRKILKKESNYDLLITIAAPHSIHWGTAFVWKENTTLAKTWVADCGDPFMGVTTDTFRPPFYFKYLEKYWCKKCNVISVPFEGAKAGYYTEFQHKIKVIPQGFNFSAIEKDSITYIKNKIPTFAYAGGFIPGARDPKEFIEYLLSLKKDFKFILYTKSIAMIHPYLKKADGKIDVRSIIPREELLKELKQMDFLVNFNNGNHTQLPSKLIDYYLTKRPILSLESYNLQKNVIDEFLEGIYLHQYIIENPEQYRIENVSKQFLELI